MSIRNYEWNHVYHWNKTDLIDTNVTITDISYNFEKSVGGKMALTFKFTGRKDQIGYDDKQSHPFIFRWKLYDENYNLIKTDTSDIHYLKVGDTFTDVKKVNGLEPGTYILSLISME